MRVGYFHGKLRSQETFRWSVGGSGLLENFSRLFWPETKLLNIKLAHQFWFSFPPPGAAGGSSSRQADEEKAKERQKNESADREQHHKQQKHDAANCKREAREIRQLDNELLNQRRAQERERQAQLGSDRQAAALATGPTNVPVGATSPPPSSTSSGDRTFRTAEPFYAESNSSTTPGRTPPNTISEEKSPVIPGVKTPLLEDTSFGDTNTALMETGQNSAAAVTPKEEEPRNVGLVAAASQKVLQEKGLPETSHLQDFPKGRQDSTESEISTIYSQSQSDACHKMMNSATEMLGSVPNDDVVRKINFKFTMSFKTHGDCAVFADVWRPSVGKHAIWDFSRAKRFVLSRFENEDSNPVTIYRCRAPIASLDCMEEFSGTTAQLDFGRSTSLGSNPAIQIRSNATTTPGLRYKNLGKSGLRVSNVGLGTWPIFSPGVSEEQAEAILRLAVDSGINLFDLSEAHSGTRAEIELGKIIQKAGWKRTSFVITTKIYWSTKSEERGLSRKHIIESVQASLQRLQLPYIDVILVHKADSMCPMEEIVRAMNYVISQGWSMYWGTARWSPVEIMEAYTNCRQFNCVTPIVEQSEYHMFCREKAELYLPEMYNKIGVGFMAWGPLSMCLGDAQNGEKLWIPKGSLKSKSQSYSWIEDEVNKENLQDEARRLYDKARDISNLAEKLGCNAVQLSIAWSLKHEPVQCLLLGATSPEQLHQSLQALQLLPRLSTGVMLEIERILENKPVRPPPISTLALRTVLKPSLLSLESLSVSLESLFYEQTALDSKFNNSSTATGTMQSTNSTVTTTSETTGLAEDKQQARQLVDCLKSIDNTVMGEKRIRYKISCSFKSLDNNCKSLFNILRGKGTGNGVAPAKKVPLSEDCMQAAPSSNALVPAHHVQSHQKGFRMLFNRKLLSDRRDSVLLAPCVNVAEH
uniref:NADP-dependent oxidoreductase domain-containing protein n=1 Tax=Anopheles christyi TaxID=43041 RepID=A0A182JSM6_9DIPT